MQTLLCSAGMVYYFTSTVVDPPATIYVGKDKVESLLPSSSKNYIPIVRTQHMKYGSVDPIKNANHCPLLDEELIKYGWEEDIWYGSTSSSPIQVRGRVD